MPIIAKPIRNEVKEMREEFCDTLISLAEKDKNVVLLDADLMSAMGTKPFQGLFPKRTFDCGIQEANMVGVAAGLSSVGFIPFVHTFGPFMSRRVADQVFVSAAYAKLNVKLIGSDPGITAQANGGTHMPFEDMGIMRCIPEVTVVEPADLESLKIILPQLHDNYGVSYMRLVRKTCTKIYENADDLVLGKASLIQDGTDVTLIASGFCVSQAIQAAKKLTEEGISVRILDMFTWKPIDEEAIVKAAQETGAIVTCENHNITTGLGAAVSEIVVKNFPVPMELIGVQDRFGQVGTLDFLAKEYHIDSQSIYESAIKVIKRKEAKYGIN
ncbi:transketolase [Erysipelothrix larvae]|uniref:Transketolase n=1 Tax=Erysipelothrix larvae TaxID=1514105 RepID=A0A0X8H0Y8_9FIRM|nr:transketolase C-terminal domain-containing protein [Erysipelothrix larvae]AMC93980.1 transketolase [Erysipelothrix larvae]